MKRRLSSLGLLSCLACGNGSETGSPSPSVGGRFINEVVVAVPNFPVAMVFTDSGRFLFTEKGGFGGVASASVRIVESGRLLPEPLITFSGVQTRGEMGLLGITLDPDYASNREVYAYYTHAGTARNRVVRFVDRRTGQTAADAQVILGDLPADVCGNHQGGTIAFGPDGMLYVTIGDNACTSCNAQSGGTLAGKILRFTRDGEVPRDNPFPSSSFPGSAFYAIGLRNSFDFVFQPGTGVIYATENGPDANDELNRILPGRNYGWPNFQCGEAAASCPGLPPPENTPPLRCYRSVIAPTGIAFYQGTVYPEAFRGNLFFGDSNTGTLRRLVLDSTGTRVLSADEQFLTGFVQIVDLVMGPDGLLYVLTSRDVRRVVFVPDR